MTIDPKLIDWIPPDATGYDEEAAKKVDTYEGLRDIGAVDFPSEYWIEPRDCLMPLVIIVMPRTTDIHMPYVN